MVDCEKFPVDKPDLSHLVFDSSQHESIVPPKGDFWLFAYGSLMWNPEFEYLRSESARLFGYHRCLCLWSVEYRGTIDHPGLVMGLDRGGSCLGRVFLISERFAEQAIDKLNRREMITGAYRPSLKTLTIANGERIEAVCLLARHDHAQYAGQLTPRTISQIVKYARGARGSNADYVLNTAHHLRKMGMVGRSLDEIVALLKQKKS